MLTGLLAAGSLPAGGATLALVSRMGLHDQAAGTMIRAVLLLTALSLVAGETSWWGHSPTLPPLLSAN